MADAAEIWKQALPVVRTKVTGIGVWSALNSCVPLAYENDTLVLGLRARDNDLAGHLKMTQTKRVMDMEVSKVLRQSHGNPNHRGRYARRLGPRKKARRRSAAAAGAGGVQGSRRNHLANKLGRNLRTAQQALCCGHQQISSAKPSQVFDRRHPDCERRAEDSTSSGRSQ